MLRLERRLALLEPGDLRPRPDDAPIGVERDGLVGRPGKRVGAIGKLAGQHLSRRMAGRAAVNAVARCIGREAEAVEPPDIMVLDQNLAVGADLRRDLLLVAQAAHQHAGPPVDEALRQPLMQRVGQAVLDRPRAALPMLRIVEPVGVMRDEGPGADLRQPVRQRVEIAVAAVGERHLVGEPIGGNLARHRS